MLMTVNINVPDNLLLFVADLTLYCEGLMDEPIVPTELLEKHKIKPSDIEKQVDGFHAVTDLLSQFRDACTRSE